MTITINPPRRRRLEMYHKSMPWEVVVSYTGRDDRWHVEAVQGGLTTIHWSLGLKKRRQTTYDIEYPRVKDLDESIALCVTYCEKQMENYRRFG